MKPLKVLFLVYISCFLSLSVAYAADDMDWTVMHDSVYENGPNTPIAGKRWTLGSIREDVSISFQLDTQTNMLRGNWHGDIRSRERFYSTVYLTDEAGRRRYLKIEDARAIGPDADYGSWKTGPATAELQVMQFDFTRDKLMAINNASALIIKYASFDTPKQTRDIIFPLDSFKARLSELDQSISAQGGRAYLLTDNEIQTTPMQSLPLATQEQARGFLEQAAKELSVSVADLRPLSFKQITDKLDDQKKQAREAANAAKRAEHQAIYDQEPEWLDINVCPKPDVRYCKNVGQEAYVNDILVGGDFSYGQIQGVVWRSKGSIVRIYGGAIEFGIEPEIYRADEAGYYYIVKSDDGNIDIRSCDGMLIR